MPWGRSSGSPDEIGTVKVASSCPPQRSCNETTTIKPSATTTSVAWSGGQPSGPPSEVSLSSPLAPPKGGHPSPHLCARAGRGCGVIEASPYGNAYLAAGRGPIALLQNGPAPRLLASRRPETHDLQASREGPLPQLIALSWTTLSFVMDAPSQTREAVRPTDRADTGLDLFVGPS